MGCAARLSSSDAAEGRGLAPISGEGTSPNPSGRVYMRDRFGTFGVTGGSPLRGIGVD